MSRSERDMKPKVNLMTQFTYEALLNEVEAAMGDVSQSLRNIGEAAGRESDWHDNAALDFANAQHDLHSSMLGGIQGKLKDVQIIQPSTETEKVGIGNSVVVKYKGEENEEIFTILGSADSGRKPGWISFDSKLASNLIGKRAGQEVTFESGGQEQKVKIIQILPGIF